VPALNTEEFQCGIRWGGVMAACVSLDKLEEGIQGKGVEREISSFADIIGSTHFVSLLREHGDGISLGEIMNDEEIFIDDADAAYSLVSKATKHSTQSQGAHQTTMTLNGPVSDELHAVFLLSTTRPDIFDFSAQQSEPVKNAARYAKRAARAFEIGSSQVLEALIDTSDAHTELQGKIYTDLSGTSKEISDHLYEFIMSNKNMYTVYRELKKKVEGEKGKEIPVNFSWFKGLLRSPKRYQSDLYELLIEKIQEQAQEEFSEKVLDIQELDKLIATKPAAEEGVQSISDELRTLTTTLFQRAAHGSEELDVDGVVWDELKEPEGAGFRLFKENGKAQKIVFQLLYVDEDKERILEFSIDSKGGSFDWSILDDPQEHAAYTVLLKKTGGELLRVFLKNSQKREDSVKTNIAHARPEPAVVTKKSGATRENTASEPVGREEKESDKQIGRVVSFVQPTNEVLRDIPLVDRPRIFGKIDDIRGGIRLQRLTRDDAFTDDGRPQFEAKTAGSIQAYRIFLAPKRNEDGMLSGDDNLEVIKVAPRRDIKVGRSKHTKRKRR